MSDVAVTPNEPQQPPAIIEQASPSAPEPADINNMGTAELRQHILDNEMEARAEAALQSFTAEKQPDGKWRVERDGRSVTMTDAEMVAGMEASQLANRPPMTVATLPDGQVEIKLATGSVYRGSTMNEAVEKLASGKVESDRTIRQLRTQSRPPLTAPDAQQQPNSFAQPQAAPSPTDDAEFAASYLTNLVQSRPELAQQLVSRALNIPAEVLPQVMQQVVHQSAESAINNTMLAFQAECQDFIPTPENCTHLLSYFPDNMGRIPTPLELKMAHARALYEKRYAPANAPAPPLPPRPRPAPMLTPSAAVSRGEYTNEDLRTMPMAQLRELAMRGGQ